MSHQYKTYVAFAEEDIDCYNLMQRWPSKSCIDFNFYHGYDLLSLKKQNSFETFIAKLHQRIKEARQVVLIGSPNAKIKGGDGNSFLYYQIYLIQQLRLPVVIANKNLSINVEGDFIPQPLIDAKYHTMSVSLQSKIIKHALDNYTISFFNDDRQGHYYYRSKVYNDLDL